MHVVMGDQSFEIRCTKYHPPRVGHSAKLELFVVGGGSLYPLTGDPAMALWARINTSAALCQDAEPLVSERAAG